MAAPSNHAIRRVDATTGQVATVPISAKVLRTISEMARKEFRIGDENEVEAGIEQCRVKDRFSRFGCEFFRKNDAPESFAFTLPRTFDAAKLRWQNEWFGADFFVST